MLKKSLMTLFVLVGALSTIAHADAPPPGYRASDEIMFKAGGIGTMGSVNFDRPSLGIAFLPVDHMQVGINVGMQYSEGGLFVTPPNLATPVPVGNWSANALVAIEYMVVDKYPFAMGPQFAFATTFAPGDAFDVLSFMPAWGFWYAPFNAPIGIGSGMGLNITLTRADNNSPYMTSVSFLTPAVRLVYVFN